MLTIKQVVSQIRSEDWFETIDLKDAYFHISILPQHRKFLRFAFRGKAYQYRVLPSVLALSPRTFTNCVDAALAPLRLQGIRILNYIADLLILAQSEILAVRHRSAPESSLGRGATTASSPILARPSMVCGPGQPPRRLSMGDSHTAGSSLSGRGRYMSPSPRDVAVVGVAPEGPSYNPELTPRESRMLLNGNSSRPGVIVISWTQ